MLLKDKVVVISGVGPGLGRKLTLLCVKEGAKVGIGCRNTTFLNDLTEEVKGLGGGIVSSPLDVKNNDQCVALVEATAKAFGRIDGLANSAYQYAPGAFEDVELDAWINAADVTCFGALRMAKAVLPHMKAAGGGSIVNISTMETRKPRPGEGAYAVPKAALEMATRQLALELGKYKIRVNATLMGWMWGVPVENALNNWAKSSGQPLQTIIDGVASQIPLNAIPTDDDCAKSVAFLLSDYANVITGQGLNVNGGEYMNT